LLWAYVDVNNDRIDSGAPEPAIIINGWFEDAVGDPVDCSNYDNSLDPGFSFITDEDPGSSGLRYDPLLKQWQFNWQTKWPENETHPDYEAGDKLPAGCYKIEVPSAFTCEDVPDGPFFVQLD
jgi:hypothetical protein